MFSVKYQSSSDASSLFTSKWLHSIKMLLMVSMSEPDSPQMLAVLYIIHSFIKFGFRFLKIKVSLLVFLHVASLEEGDGDSASHTAGTRKEATESPGGE